MVRSERLELSWTISTRPSTVPVYQFQHDRNMSQIKSMTTMFQIDKFKYEFKSRSKKNNRLNISKNPKINKERLSHTIVDL